MSAPERNKPDNPIGAIVLCGGKSTRMGMDKTQLIFQGQTFLERVVRQVQPICHPVVLVGDTDLAHHDLPSEISIVGDEQVGKGPLEGIRVGLERLANQAEYAFVTSCDVPLIRAELIRFLFEQIGNYEAVIPVEGNRVYGLTAVYRTRLHKKIGHRTANNQLRVSDLATAFKVNRIDVEGLKVVDPTLDSLTNVNSASDYLRLLKRFGLDCPEQFVGRFA